MIYLIPLIIPAQHAGFEYLLIILLVMFWGIYRYYKSSKARQSPDDTDETDENATFIPDYDIPETKAVFREPFVDNEINIYNSRGSDPISASLRDTSSENTEDQHDNATDPGDFDLKKAVIWSEIIKRPYC